MKPVIPDDVLEQVTAFLSNDAEETIFVKSFAPVGGGCINHGGILRTTSGDFFLKWNRCERMTGMMEAEASGLLCLADAAAIAVPDVIGHGSDDAHQWILLSLIIPASRASNFWSLLGERLAALHRHTQAQYGWTRPNYIGSLPQENTPTDSWTDFFWHHRLEKQLRIALNAGRIDVALVHRFGRLEKELMQQLPEEKPALLHGDLWHGNLMTDPYGEPCLIDPAVYYGHRESDIAFTMLFGGFETSFYRAYHEAFPLEAGFDARAHLYNLYPLLVHVNLFGAGYLPQVKAFLKKTGC